MNIFTTDLDAGKAAEALDDKRVIKLILECGQMLSTAIWLEEPDYALSVEIYKPGHQNHPCTLWARETDTNYRWLLSHMLSLTEIYTAAYQKVHKSLEIYDALSRGVEYIPPGELTKFANCAQRSDIGVSYRHIKDPVEAYRAYLVHRWSLDTRPVSFLGRSVPDWAEDYPHYENITFR